MEHTARSIEEQQALRQSGKDLIDLVPREVETGEHINAKTIKLQSTLDDLLSAAYRSDATVLERTAATNPLCALLEACNSSSVEDVRLCIWEKDLWYRAFQLFLERSENSKPRSARQLLLVLTAILRQDIHADHSGKVKRRTVRQILSIVSGNTNRPCLKPALQALECFMHKDAISVPHLLGQYDAYLTEDRTGENLKASGRQLLDKLLLVLFDLVPGVDSAHAAGQLIATLIFKCHQQKEDLQDVFAGYDSIPFWAPPLFESYGRHVEEVQSYKNQVFSGVLSLNLTDYLSFLRCLGLASYVDLVEQGSKDKASASRVPVDNEARDVLLFAALQSGKEQGLILEIDSRQCKQLRKLEKHLELPDTCMSRVIGDLSPSVRLAALSFMISTSSITRPFTPGVLQSLLQVLPNVIADTDANVRAEILNLVRRLFDRLRASTAILQKDIVKKTQKIKTPEDEVNEGLTASKKLLQESKVFLQSFMHYLESDLRPTAQYQRHYVALRCILIGLSTGLDPNVPHALAKQAKGAAAWPFQMIILNRRVLRSLSDLLMNAFDDVRATASSILKLNMSISTPDQGIAATPQPQKAIIGAEDQTIATIKALPRDFVDRAEDIMLKTGRADHADGVARTYELLCLEQSGKNAAESYFDEGHLSARRLSTILRLVKQLEATIIVAQKDLHLAVTKNPMHGLFASIRYIIDQPGFYTELGRQGTAIETLSQCHVIHARIFDSLRDTWDVVKNILCNEAPEGHFPSELEGEQDLTTKDVLSYSWRALKEGSLLLRTIATHGTFFDIEHRGAITVDQFASLGSLCFTQLTELRHRGAFSTVAQTFAAFCARCMRAKIPQVYSLPQSWFEETMRAIRNKSTVLTRRSGGIPSLMSGILTAAPDGPLFHRAMEELHLEATEEGIYANIEESNLPQVHALNSLKDIFTNTKLGSASEAYVGKALVMAGKKLESNIWSIRNCGLMLFRALIDRLLGSNEQQMSLLAHQYARLSYDQYPGLLDLVLGFLQTKERVTGNGQSAHGHLRTEAVFPALQILQRAPPPASHIGLMQGLALNLVKSPDWHIRDMAARTLARSLDANQMIANLSIISVLEFESQNDLHGRLLALRYAVMMALQRGIATDEIEALYTHILGYTESVYEQNDCPVTRAAYLDVVYTVCKGCLHRKLVSPDPFQARPSNNLKISETRLLDSVEMNLVSISIDSFYDEPEAQKNTRMSALLRQAAVKFIITSLLATLLTTGLADSAHKASSSKLQMFLEQVATTEDVETVVVAVQTLAHVTELVEGPITPALACELAQALEHARLHIDPRPCGEALSAMADLIRRSQEDAQFHERSGPFSAVFDNIEFQWTDREAPSVQLSSLTMTGFVLDLRLHQLSYDEKTNKAERKLEEQLEKLSAALHCSLQDTRYFPQRKAAVEALGGLRHLWTLPPSKFSQSRLRLTLVTYDALNDDDDEIRDIAAVISARILACNPKSSQLSRTQIPLIASSKLAQHLATQYSQSAHLFHEAVQRLCGGLTLLESVTSFEEVFASARKTDTALFAQEKQNLFIDPVREALLWSRVLTTMNANAVPAPLASSLTTWTMDGLKLLTLTAESERDGALGWTSNQEMFCLGMRVFCAAEVLLVWRENAKVVEARGSEIKGALAKFWEVAKKMEIHEDWIERVEKVLEKAAMRKLEMVKGAIGVVVPHIP